MPKTVFIALASSVLLIFGFLVYEKSQQPALVTSILNLPSRPASLKVLTCKSPVGRDVRVTCVISINPGEFSSLLQSHAFQEHPRQGSSYTKIRKNRKTRRESSQSPPC